MLADWILSAAPGFDGEEDGDQEFQALPSRMAPDFGTDALEALEAAVTFAPTPLAAVREARAWREVIAPTQQGSSGSNSVNNNNTNINTRGGGRGGGEKQQKRQHRSVLQLPSLTHAGHLLGLIGCCPSGELEAAFPWLARELLVLLRQRQRSRGAGAGAGETRAAGGSADGGDDDDDGDGSGGKTCAVALAAVDEAVRRLLHNAGGAAPVGGGGGGGGSSGGGGNSKVGGGVEVGGSARQAVVAVLPKLVPAVTACLEGSVSADGASSVPPPAAVASGALGVLEALVFLLRSTMRPHVKKVEAATALWLQGPSDVIRDRAAAVLASLPLCGEAEAWTQAAGRVALEAHGLLHAAWPDHDIDMGSGDTMSASQLDAALGSGVGLLPPLAAGAASEGFSGPQQVLAALVSRRFKGLCRVLELMLVGDSNGRPVAVPVVLILALVERVQRMASSSSAVKGHGPQAFIPVAQGALSHGALHAVRPSLDLASSRLLHALATTGASTVLRNARRFCRALVQGVARPSAAGSLRAAGYRSVSRAMLQLGESAAPHLATPALPALLAEVRAVVAASDPRASEAGGSGGGGGSGAADALTAPETTSGGSGSGGGGGGKRGMGIEPAMSARKSSQKKLRRSREKEVGRTLAAADAAATAAAAGNGVAVGGGGMVWTGAAALAEQEAVCAGMSCLSQLVVCCGGHLPLGGRLAVEDVLHRGLELLAHAGAGGSRGSSGEQGRAPGGGGGGRIGGTVVGGGCSRLEDPQVAREFFGLAQACLMTPLADGTRSGSLSIAIAAFRAFGSHPDQQLAAASQRALAGCGAVLYPRAAPLHLPHAVTSQARAWGVGAGSAAGGYGLPMGWGDTLTGAQEEESDGGGDDYEEYAQAGQSSGGGAGATLTVQAAGTTARDSAPTAAAAPVVTPPASSALQNGGRGGNDSTPQAVPVEPAPVGTNKGNTGAISESLPSKGKGKGKGKDRATTDGDSSRSTGTTAKGNSSKDGAGASVATAVATTAEGGDDSDDANQRRKRPRSEDATDEEGEAKEGDQAVEIPKAAGADGEGRGTPAPTKQQARQPAATAVSSRDGDGGDDDDDDDGFEFPAIVDADPDDE